MILKRRTGANPWSPEGFERFVDVFPATEWVAPPRGLDRTARFKAIWNEPATSALPREVGIVLTPGVFAEWLPTCFRAARRAFAADGHDVLQTCVRSSRGIRAQARAIGEQILEWLRPGRQFVWCAHSRGGLDALWALEQSAPLRAGCAAVIAVQPPVAHSWIIEHWRRSRATLGERLLGATLRSPLFRDGVRDISLRRDPLVTRWLAGLLPVVPLLHAVSWSVCPTSWVDSYHRTLGALRPGHAHDGQLYLCDQCLPSVPLVGLPSLDHAQPVLGGSGFDAARLWRALVACAWLERGGTAKR